MKNTCRGLLKVLQERFRLDALGLVSMLGESTIRDLYGRLENPHDRLWDFLPTLAIHTVLDNSMLKPVYGFTLYNISDDFKATDLSAWFTRWLSTQDFTDCFTTLRIRNDGDADDVLFWGLCSSPWALYLFFAFLGLYTGVLDEPVSHICYTGMMVASISRVAIIDSCRAALDIQAKKSKLRANKYDLAKIIVTLPGGQLIRIETTRDIVRDCLLTDAKPPNPRKHFLRRFLGWTGLSVHMLTLGMCTPIKQLRIIGILVMCTAIRFLLTYTSQAGMLHHIGKRLTISRHEIAVPETREKMFARLRLSRAEEQSLRDWGLMPQETNQVSEEYTFEHLCADATVDTAIVDTWRERVKEARRARKEKEWHHKRRFIFDWVPRQDSILP